MQNQPNGNVFPGEQEGKEKKDAGTGSDKEVKTKRTLKGATSAIRFVSKLSPKSVRKKSDWKKALIKVCKLPT